MDPIPQHTTPLPIDAAALLDVVAAVAREARPHMEPRVALDASLEKDLGLDSLARVELVLRLEKVFQTSLPERALATAETPRDLLRFVLSGAGQPAHAAGAASARPAQGGGVPPPVHAPTLTEALLYHVAHQPDRLTVYLYEEGAEHPITYRQLWDNALGYAARLTQSGLAPGQMVAIMLPTCKEYLYAFYGVMLAGGVPVPLYPPARLATIQDHMTRHVGILRSAGASMIVTVPEAKPLAYLLRAQVESLRAVLVPADLEGPGAAFAPVHGQSGDIAFLQYTSGSTGEPKGVVLTHANILANVAAAGAALGATQADVFVSWLPLYHDMGLVGGCFATMYFGFPVVLMSPLAFLARPSSWLQAIHRHRGTLSGGPNFCYELCLRRIPEEQMEGVDLSSWRFAFNGAEPVSAQTMTAFSHKFARWGLRANAMSPVYGLAECTVGLAVTPPSEPWQLDTLDRDRFTRSGEAVAAPPGDPAPLQVVGCGKAFAGHDLRVVDAMGLELADGHEGLLQFRGPSASSGYYHNPKATHGLFDGAWVNTGDRAYLRDGTLFVTGREKDIIIRAGRNISPYELEQAVGGHPAIRRGCVAVFGSRDPATGTERLVVLAELRVRDDTRQDALKHAINALAVHIIGEPADDIVLAPPGSVPKTSSGKIRRVAAREIYEHGYGSTRRAAVWRQFARLLLASAAPQLRRALRAASSLLFAARAYLAFGVQFPVVFAAALLVPGRRCWQVGRTMAGWFLRSSGIAVVAKGLDHLPRDVPVVLAVNHTSYLDPVVLLSLLEYRGHAFVGKRELRANFVMRTLAEGFGTVFVERFDVAASVVHARELAAAAQRGVSLIMFPEGTLERRTGLRPFRTGAFQAAALAGIPVVPVALRGLRSVLRDGTWYPRRATVSVTFGAPIAPQGTDWAAAAALRDAVRAEILRHCGEPDLEREPAPGHAAPQPGPREA